MYEYDDDTPNRYAWIAYAIAIGIVGSLAGYIITVQAGRPTASLATTGAAQTSAPLVDEAELRAYRDILAQDPRNAQAAVKAGNLLYDAQRYIEAIPFYQQAFALLPSDINVSTDLGTALWYAGRPDDALAQYTRSLALDRTHAQTLFNLGIVRADGKGDYAGAIAVWDTLLGAHPDYRDASRVRTLIADARAKLRG
jgi:tetratricopeptide (TPR) repeat protein